MSFHVFIFLLVPQCFSCLIDTHLDLRLYTASRWHSEYQRQERSHHAVWRQLIEDNARAWLFALSQLKLSRNLHNMYVADWGHKLQTS